MGVSLVLHWFVMMVPGVNTCQVINTHVTGKVVSAPLPPPPPSSPSSLLVLLLPGRCSGPEIYSEENVHCGIEILKQFCLYT